MFNLLTAALAITLMASQPIIEEVKEEIGPGVIISTPSEALVEEALLERELLYDEMEMVAQLVQAEAGNQDLDGMRLVVDVVLNRRDHPCFPDTVEEVIRQRGQFQVMRNGAFERAGNYISPNAYKAVEMEYFGERMDYGIIYFATYKANGKGFWKHGGHWFSY